jgi:CBS domain-containing protein
MNKIREIMKKRIIGLPENAPASDAAKQMRDSDVGAVIVTDKGPDGRLVGIVTDRDIAVRVVANDKDPKTTPLSEICSRMVATLSPEHEIDHAVHLMRTRAIRRAPVVDAAGQVLGIVSLGDLAIERDRKSALGAISAAAPNR